MPQMIPRPPAPSPTTDDWYVRSFGPLYGLLYRHRNDDQARHEARQILTLLDLHPGDRLVDVCCGTGRHLAAFCDLDLHAVGVDLSEPLLHDAADRPQLRGRLIRADVRALPLAPVFDAAVNLFTSFGYFPDESQDRLALRQMALALRPGGRLLMDLINPPHLRRELRPHDCQRIESLVVEHRREIVGPRVLKHTTLTDPAGRRTELYESVRFYTPGELTELFHAAGLRTPRFLGSFAGEPLTDDSPRLIAVGERR